MAEADRLEQRTLRAAEAILQSESLTADLRDAEAEVLLEWGLARAEACARKTRHLADAQANARIAGGISTIRKSMRRINALLAERTHFSPTQLTRRMEDLISVAVALPRVGAPNNRRVQSRRAIDKIPRLVRQAQRLTDSQLLEHVLALADAAADERRSR